MSREHIGSTRRPRSIARRNSSRDRQAKAPRHCRRVWIRRRSSARPIYRLRVLPADDANGGYSVEAAPTETGPMRDDACGTFTLDATGLRGNQKRRNRYGAGKRRVLEYELETYAGRDGARFVCETTAERHALPKST